MAAWPLLRHTDSTQHMPEGDSSEAVMPGAAVPKVAIDSCVAWDALVGDDDSDVEGWPDHADPVDMDHANVPAATRPSTFLEAARKMAGSDEVLIFACKDSTSVGRQAQSGGRANGTLHTGADPSWHHVGRKSNAAGMILQSNAQPAAVWRHVASVRAGRDIGQAAGDTNGGGGPQG